MCEYVRVTVIVPGEFSVNVLPDALTPVPDHVSTIDPVPGLLLMFDDTVGEQVKETPAVAVVGQPREETEYVGSTAV